MTTYAVKVFVGKDSQGGTIHCRFGSITDKAALGWGSIDRLPVINWMRADGQGSGRQS